MEENFNLAAQSRANYYTAGSPVQFVRVELLKGEQSGDNAVCLTFKNIGDQPITGLDVRFKCKAADGTVLCEETFNYEGLNAGQGELFGMDDAVFITASAIGSVDVHLEWVYSGKMKMDLQNKKRVRLPAPKKLSAEMSAKLEQKAGREGLRYVPQVLENGWYCACGAFHPNEENTVYCSECGGDRVLLQNALSGIMQPQQTRPIPKVEEPTRVAGAAAAPVQQGMPLEQYDTRAFAPGSTAAQPAEVKPQQPKTKEVAVPSAADQFVQSYHADLEQQEEPDAEEYEEYDPRDERAEAIIRWVPALTVLVCVGIALGGFLYCNLVL